ncbi:MAG: hypothetical protein LBU23_02720 [Planctomycetota bacterium]|jgi:hypothetical protein|nr:hypothetical protein [Planctomycetota bacterium]
MKTVYVNRFFSPVSVEAVRPGDIHDNPVLGVCRRLTARRLALAAERAGRDSEAIQGLLRAIGEAAPDGRYDGRDIADWYGLVGLTPPPPPTIDDDLARLEPINCPGCHVAHWCRREADGSLYNRGYCEDCYWLIQYEPTE